MLESRQAAGIWYAVMQYLGRTRPADGWQIPPGIQAVSVCDPSGMLPTASCPSIVKELFLSGNEPTQADILYQDFQVNRETGRLATVFTPLELVDTRTCMVVPEEALDWAGQAGVPLPPREYDSIAASQAVSGCQHYQPRPFRICARRGEYPWHSRRGELQFLPAAGRAGYQSTKLDAAQYRFHQIRAQWKIGFLGHHRPGGVIRPASDSSPPGPDDRDGSHPAEHRQHTPNHTYQLPTGRPGLGLGHRAEIILQVEATDAIGAQRVAWYIDGK